MRAARFAIFVFIHEPVWESSNNLSLGWDFGGIMMQIQSTAPVKEPNAPPNPKRTVPLPQREREPGPVRVPAPAPLPDTRPSFQPSREAPIHAPPERFPKPLQPFCPVPE